MTYATSQELWKNLGKDAYTKVRSEIVGTGDASTTVFSLDHDNLISGSNTIYTDSTVVSTGSYSINLDDGKITFSSAPASGSVITADYDYADIPDSWIQEILKQADDELERITGRTFTSSTNYTEYLDVEESQSTFYLKNYPIIKINYVSANTASSVADTPAWSASTEGLGNDFIVDSDSGRIRYIDNLPSKGERRLKVNYDYGYSTIPETIKELAILLAIRKMVNSTIYKSIIKGYDNFTPVRLEEIENRINQLINLYRKQNIELV